jgi:hypothetical protein
MSVTCIFAAILDEIHDNEISGPTGVFTMFCNGTVC